MPRPKKEDKDHVVVLGSSAQPKRKGPTDIDCKAYDRLVLLVHRVQRLTREEGWNWFFSGMLDDAAAAAKALKSCKKMNDVIGCQATIAYAESQTSRLKQLVVDLNAMRERWPLFTGEMPWRADFDEPTGRVNLVWAGKGQAPDGPPQLTERGTGEVVDAPPADMPPASVPTPPTQDEDEDETGEDEDDDLDPGGAEDDDPFGS